MEGTRAKPKMKKSSASDYKGRKITFGEKKRTEKTIEN